MENCGNILQSAQHGLTNDDGFDAEGIQALDRAADSLGRISWVAPHVHLSGCSHRVTTNQPLKVSQLTPGRWVLEGTPADCVRVGLAHLVADADWVLSGINHGGNLGADVHVSGTVAAVREGVLHGKPGIAVSQYRKADRAIDWNRAIRWLTPLLTDLLGRSWLPGTFWNINLPHLEPGDPDPQILHCPVDSSPLPLSFRVEAGSYHYNGNYHQRPRLPGSDVDVCFSGNIAVSRVKVASNE